MELKEMDNSVFIQLANEAEKALDKEEVKKEKNDPKARRDWFLAYFNSIFFCVLLMIIWFGVGCLHIFEFKYLFVLDFLFGCVNGLDNNVFGGLLGRALLMMGLASLIKNISKKRYLYELFTNVFKGFKQMILKTKEYINNKVSRKVFYELIGFVLGIILSFVVSNISIINSFVLCFVFVSLLNQIVTSHGLVMTCYRILLKIDGFDIEKESIDCGLFGCVVGILGYFIFLICYATVTIQVYPVVYYNIWTIIIGNIGAGILGIGLCTANNMVDEGSVNNYRLKIRKNARYLNAKRMSVANYNIETAIEVECEIDKIDFKLVNEKDAIIKRNIHIDNKAWNYILDVSCDDDSKCVKVTCVNDILSIEITGGMMYKNMTAGCINVFAWCKEDNIVYKAKDSISFELYDSLLLAFKENDELKVHYYTSGNMKGILEIVDLEKSDYTVLEEDKMVVLNRDISKYCSIE